MALTAVFATLLLCQSGSTLDQQVSESVAEAPAVQNTFIEVDLVAPIVVEKGQVPTDAAPETVEDPAIDPSAEIRESIGQEIELLDQIEPMFAEDVEMVTGAESEPVETAPLDSDIQVPQQVEQDAVGPAIIQDGRIDLQSEPQSAGEGFIAPSSDSAEPIGQLVEPMDVVPSVIIEDVTIAEGAATIADPQPTAVEQSFSSQNSPTAEPVAEPTPIVEPAVGADLETVTGAEQQAVEESASYPTAESAGPVEHDADPLGTIQPMIIENGGSIPDLQPEPINQAVVSPLVESKESVEHDAVVPNIVENAGIIPAPQPEVVEGQVSEPAITTAPPVTEPARVIAPDNVVAFERVAGADPEAAAKPVNSPNSGTDGSVKRPMELVEPAIVDDAGNVIKHGESSNSDDGSSLDASPAL